MSLVQLYGTTSGTKLAINGRVLLVLGVTVPQQPQFLIRKLALKPEVVGPSLSVPHDNCYCVLVPRGIPKPVWRMLIDFKDQPPERKTSKESRKLLYKNTCEIWPQQEKASRAPE